MNLLEIVDKRDLLKKELLGFTEKIKVEHRKLNESENSDFIRMKNEIAELNKQIEDIKEADLKIEKRGINLKNNKENMNNNFSLLRTIRNIVENRGFDETQLPILDAGKKAFAQAGLTYRGQITLPAEFRGSDILNTTDGEGGHVAAEEKFQLLNALRAKTVLGQAGATFYSGLVGDVSIPVYAGSSVDWAFETSGATNGGGAFTEVTLTPKRLTGYIDISKQFIIQDSISAEQSLYNDLINAILVKVEASAFDATASSTTRPAGMFYGASYTGDLSGTTTYAKLVGMKSAVDTSNALTGNLAYITNPTLDAVLETTDVSTSTGIFCKMNGKVAGYPVYVTSNVPSISPGQGIVFGNWADFVVGQWGGMDITVDPYSQSIYGKVRIVVNTYWDFKVRRSASFKYNRLS